jgi:hypothetical protein
MKYRALDAAGDYQFGGGSGQFYQDVPEAVAQAVRTRLGLWAGEWFLDATEGTAWETRVLGTGTAGTRDIEIKTRILETPGVTGIVSYSSDYNADTRAFSISATISTLYGNVSVFWAP